MKRCPDNQINASFIDILRIKWQSKTMDINPSLQICGWNVNGIGRG